jgi:hypothetical protein
MSGKKQADDEPQADEHVWVRAEELAIELLSGRRDDDDRRGWDALTRLLRTASLNEPAYRALPRKVARELMYQANRDGLRNRHFVIEHRSAGRGGGADFERDLKIEAYCRELEAKKQSFAARKKYLSADARRKARTQFSLKLAQQEFALSRNAISEARKRAKYSLLPSISPKPKRTKPKRTSN